ncbi:MAG: hypothetical protein M1455_00540 [Actinobacteria bacterium]|nr:hypothetical protein [Actinomycetota bacterium]
MDFEGQNDCQRAYLVHIGSKTIGKVQKKLRDLYINDPDCKLNKRTMQLKWADDDTLKSLDGEGLQAAIITHVEPDMDAYVKDKQELVNKVGYENSGGLMKVTVNIPQDVDPDRHIVDFDLGIVSQLEVNSGSIYDNRFGTNLLQADLEKGSILEIVSIEPIGNGEIVVTNEDLGETARLDCKVFVPSAFGHLLPKEKIRARFSHRFLECIVPFAGTRQEVTFTFKFPEPEETVSINDLHDLSELVLIIGEAIENSHKIVLSTKLNDEKVGSGVINIGPGFSPTMKEWAKLVQRAWIVARHFELDKQLALNTRELSQHEGPLLTMAGFLDHQRRDFRLTFWMKESDSLQGKECCIPLVAMTNLGQQIVGLAAGLIGMINLTGEKKDNEVQCEVVTHDVRIESQYVGDDIEEAKAESEKMKERVNEKYSEMHIIQLEM